MDPNARRPPVPESWLRPSRGGSPWRDVLGAVVLGWLVLMTVWGFGRSGFPEHDRWFLAAGLAGAAVVVAAGVRRARRRRRGTRAEGSEEHGTG